MTCQNPTTKYLVQYAGNILGTKAILPFRVKACSEYCAANQVSLALLGSDSDKEVAILSIEVEEP